jgi:hypothetical protein
MTIGDADIDIVGGAYRNPEILGAVLRRTAAWQKQSIKSGVANLSPSGAGVIAAVNALGAAIGEQTRRIGGIGDEVESMAPG